MGGEDTHLPPELRDILPADGKACRQLMAAVAFQQRGQGGEGGKQIEAPMAAGAGLAVLPVQADEKGGAGKFLGNAAGDNAHHALMPALIGQHNGIGQTALGQHIDGLLINF